MANTDSTISDNYVLTNHSSSLLQREISATPGTPAVLGDYASGSVSILAAGASFDSGSYPRFNLNDGTLEHHFVIDSDARAVELSNGNDAGSFSATSQLPLEDPHAGRMVVPTKSKYQGAEAAYICFFISDHNEWSFDAHNLSTNNGGALSNITSRPHYTIRDSEGKTINIGYGASGSWIVGGGAAEVPGVSYGGGHDGKTVPSYVGYRESNTSTNFYIASNMTGYSGGGSKNYLYNAWIALINYAQSQNLIDINAKAITPTGHLQDQTSYTASNYQQQWTDQTPQGLHLSSRTSGSVGNTCYIQFNDPNNYVTGTNPQRRVSWGYSDFQPMASNSDYRHNSSYLSGQSDSLFFAQHKAKRIYFRRGAPSGSTNPSGSLTAAQIAQEVRSMIEASELNVSAVVVSSSVVQITNNNRSAAGNYAITASSAGGLITALGMQGGISDTPEVADQGNEPPKEMHFRVGVKGVQNIRGQTTSSRYRTFIGEDKS